MKTFFIPVVTFVTMIILFQSCKDDTAERTIDVRGLFSLTGNWSSLGINSQAAMDIAAEDINDYLDNKDSNFRFGVSVSDTKLDTSLVKTFFTEAKDDDIKFIIGPQSSAELAAIKPSAMLLK